MKRALSFLLAVCALISLSGAASGKSLPTRKTAEAGFDAGLVDVCIFPSERQEGTDGYALVGLCADGTVRTFGLEDSFDADAVKRIENWSEIIQIMCCETAVAGLKADGTVVFEEIRPYEDLSRLNPRYDPGRWEDVVQLVGGYMEFYGLTSDGCVMLYGDPAAKPLLGEGHYLDWEKISKLCFYIYPEDRGLFAMTTYGSVKRKDETTYLFTETPEKVKDIDTSGYLFCCLREDGTLLITGVNAVCNDNLIKSVQSLRGVEQVSAGWRDVAVRYANGRVEVCPSDPYYQTKTWRGVIDICRTDTKLLGLTEDGRVLMTGAKDEVLDTSDIGSWRDVKRIRGGEGYVLGWKSDGTLLAAGIDLSVLNTSSAAK